MDIPMMLDKLVKTLGRVKLGGRKGSRELAALDRGVMNVALLVAALDGTIRDEEWNAFKELALSCRGDIGRDFRRFVDSAIEPVSRLIAMAQIPVYTEKDRLAYFIEAAEKALPHGFTSGSVADLRRAFALWTGIGVADGDFSIFERMAITHLVRKFVIVRRCPLLEGDFLDRAERIMTDLRIPAKRGKAAAELERLVSSVGVADAKGKVTERTSASIAVKAALLGALCFAGAGKAEAGGMWTELMAYLTLVPGDQALVHSSGDGDWDSWYWPKPVVDNAPSTRAPNWKRPSR